VRLIHERGDERIAYPLDEGETFVGRKEYCDIQVPDTSLSKRHALFVRTGSALTVEDAGSKNGTLVNGELIDEPFELQNGDVVQLGKARFVVEGIPDGPADSADDFDLVGEDEVLPQVSGGSYGGSSYGGSKRVTARAVASHEVRPSVLDVLPEVPASVEEEAPLERATARFRLVEGGPEREWDLDGETITIGTKPENAIQIEGDGISRYHAEVTQEEGAWVLKDLGARNGLFVAGVRVDIHELQDGDEVQIGTARLRFERVQPSPLAGLKEVVDKVLRDPVGSFQEDPRLRIGGAAVLVGLLLLVMIALGGGGDGGGGPPVADMSWCAEGTALLRDGDYEAAEEVFRKAVAHGPASRARQELPRALQKIATQWKRTDSPMTFRWSKAEELLQSVAGMEDLPGETKVWIDRQLDWVAANREAYEDLAGADALGAQASELGRQEGKFDDAVSKYRDVLARYDAVPAGSLFAEKAAERLAATRQRLFAFLMEEVRRRKEEPSAPDWNDALEAIRLALEFADDPEQRARLRRMAEECQVNQRDEGYYLRAVEIVQMRDVKNYPVAVRLLQQIDRRSLIFPDAQAYISWIDADLKVRQARKAYDNGDKRRAFLLLNQALQHEVLGPEARASVRTRRQKWARVIRAFENGMRAYREGRTQDAEAELARVLEYEKSKANRFNQMAQSQLRHIAQTEAFGLERKLREGLEELRRGKFRDALQWFNRVKEDPNVSSRDLDKIRQAVADVARGRRVVHTAKNMVRRDRTEVFLDLYYQLKALVEWLPPRHRDLEDAHKFYEIVRERLNTILGTAPR